MHRLIHFIQKAWLKPYLDMNSKTRKVTKNCFEKYIFKLIVFRKTMENVRKCRDTKLVTRNKRKDQLVSKPNYHTKNGFQRVC